MLNRIAILALILGLLVTGYATFNRAQMAVAQVPTIPTRTPTPPPSPPTNTPAPLPTNPPQPTSPPAATNTATPGATATNTAVSPTIDPGTLLPTAEACGEPPTAQAINNINVRSGPGTDYDILRTLTAGQVRVIVGRAEFAEWWVILLPNGRDGWVADFTVRVQGYTGNVPLVAAPTLNGSTPTPGPQWQPTLQPDCPTATPTQEPTATPSATATATAVAPTRTTTPETTAASPELAQGSESATSTSQAPPALPGDREPTATPAADAITSQQPTATAVPLASDQDTGSGSNLLLIAGVVLIVLGIIGAVVLRR